jgi:hypothetical protein
MRVLNALWVHLGVIALVLKTVEGGTLQTCHNPHGAGHILATVALNLEILGLYWRLGVTCASC